MPEEKANEGMSALQYNVCTNIYSCLGIVFMGFAFLAACFAFMQTYKQIKESREHHQFERIMANIDKLSSNQMSSEVCEFLEELCKWHIDERIWERCLDMSQEQTKGYNDLKKKWAKLTHAHVATCLHIVLLLKCKENISLENNEKLLIDAVMVQEVGRNDMRAVAALCYAAAKKEPNINQLLKDAGIYDELDSLEKYIKKYLQNYTKYVGYGDVDAAYKEVMDFIQKKYKDLK